ncbi:Hypothetical predicted protein [Olea europaea subsp. europaea]|uniref:Uncharacterized protein n=1 Tax=Olea europaea subsp. europaea TaxID=158383 RepID=A0A8S0VJL2_OLEEU|nr:Hypothetical predicted protein [Olea europaea subsp. europaea]
MDVDDQMRGLPQLVEKDLVDKAASNAEKSKKLHKVCNETSLQAKAMRLTVEELLNQVRSNMTWAQTLVKELSSYIEEDSGLVNIASALEEAKQLMHFVRESDLEALGRFANKTHG